MGLAALVLRNQLHHARKIIPVMLLCGLILLVPAASLLLTGHIRQMAARPLAALDTELILQLDRGAKEAAGVQTRGLVEPFQLHGFPEEEARRKLAAITGLSGFSMALTLWRFDPRNTLTVVGLAPEDPPVGLRKIEHLLMAGSRFFSPGQADEVILERHYAKLFGHKPGGLFPLAGRDLRIIGIVDFTEQSNLSNAAVFLPYATALTLANQEQRIANQVYLALDSAAEMQQVSRQIEAAFPGFSLLSRDSLYKNLSSINQLIYRGGHLLVGIISPVALLLLFWLLRLHRLEFAGQTLILRTIGWPRRDLACWLAWDLGYLVTGAAILAVLTSAVLAGWLLPLLTSGPLLDQGFHL